MKIQIPRSVPSSPLSPGFFTQWKLAGLKHSLQAFVYDGSGESEQIKLALGYLGFYELPAQVLAPRASVACSDILIITGVVTEKAWPRLLSLYNQMPDPKYIIIAGANALSGGVFKTPHIVCDLPSRLHADILIPGSPVQPESFVKAIVDLKDRLMSTRFGVEEAHAK
jgi:Ni,Fe-hydrogenase III small subunit